ncbi:MAG: RNA 2',3'-cyclic phosphodiesterase [bacterium]|nr:RNA 2',3'-cyclic phosphodiesterase [bacterium]
MRLFVAVDPGERFRAEVSPCLDAWRARWDFGWVRTEQLHVTLRFLGEWPPARLDDLQAALAAAAGETPPLRMSAGGLDAFPGWRRPRVLVLQMESGGALEALAARIDGAVARRCPGLGAQTAGVPGPPDPRAVPRPADAGRARRPAAVPAAARRHDRGHRDPPGAEHARARGRPPRDARGFPAGGGRGAVVRSRRPTAQGGRARRPHDLPDAVPHPRSDSQWLWTGSRRRPRPWS